MKPRMLLHVGTHKTGSTAIQNYLADNADTLPAAGFVYPVAARFGNQHAGLPGCFLEHHAFVPPVLLGIEPKEVVAGLRAEVPDGCAAVVSSEVCWEVLEYMPDSFEAMMTAVSTEFEPIVVYMVRDPHEKSWSAVKHMARSGMTFDVVGTYRRDIEHTAHVEQRLLASHPDSVRVAYDGRDSVAQFLKLLAQRDTPWGRDAGPGVLRARDGLVAARESRRDRRARPNGDFSNPYSAAVTVCVSMALNDAGDLSDRQTELGGLTAFYRSAFGKPPLDLTRYGLPDDATLGERVRAAAESGRAIMTETEQDRVRAFLSSPKVRIRAARTRTSPALRAVRSILT